MSLKQRGRACRCPRPLGNGFPVNEVQPGKTALLVGGGVGVPPLQELSKRLNEKGVKVIHVLGFQSAKDVFYEEECQQYGDTYVATADGSYGETGFVTNVIKQKNLEFDILLSRGPTPMLKALKRNMPIKKSTCLWRNEWVAESAHASRVCHTNESETSYVKVCLDGPVFKAQEVAL